MSGAEWTALWLSAKVAGAAVLCALPAALVLAWWLSRGRFAGRMLLNVIVHLPLVLPPVVVGYLLLVSLGQSAPLGRWFNDVLGHRFVFHWSGAALAAALVTLPFQVRSIRLAFDNIDPELEHIARTLGASRWTTWRTVTLPLAWPGIVAGVVTAFAAALGEFGAIITFASNVPGETRTLPLAIYTALQSPGGETMAARLALLSISLAVAGLLLAEMAVGRLSRARA